jgi:hypothetical protein
MNVTTAKTIERMEPSIKKECWRKYRELRQRHAQQYRFQAISAAKVFLSYPRSSGILSEGFNTSKQDNLA